MLESLSQGLVGLLREGVLEGMEADRVMGGLRVCLRLYASKSGLKTCNEGCGHPTAGSLGFENVLYEVR
jgi:hypothetical protein